MPSESGLIYDFSKVDLVIGAGFRVDAFADAGFDVSWLGDLYALVPGADDNNVIVRTGNTAALLTTNLQQSSKFLDHVSAWLLTKVTRPLSFEDRNGKTFMTATRSIPRQQPGMTFNAGHNPRAIDIHCPNLRGVSGALSE